MTDANEVEFGNQASKVRLQDEVGKIKNRQGEACIEVIDNQNVGIGTDSPDRKLEILDASNPQLRLTHTDATHYAELQSLSDGNAVIEMTGNTTHLRSPGANSVMQIQNSSTGYTNGWDDGLTVGCAGKVAYIWMRESDSSMNIGAGGTGGITLDSDNNIVALEGSFQLKAEIAAPSAPGSGDGGIFYVKTDGIPYYISDSTAETSLVGGGGGDLTMTVVSTAVDGATYSAATYNTMYVVTSTTGVIEINLPTAVGNAGKTIDILSKTGAAYAVTVDPNSAETINGNSASIQLTTDYANITLVSDNSNWLIQ